MGHRVGGDGGPALGPTGDLPPGQGVQPGLDGGLVGRIQGPGPGRVGGEDVLGVVHAHPADQPGRARVAPEHLGHGRDGVGHVVAPGPAREGQPAGDGHPPRVPGRQPEGVQGQI